MWWPWKGGENDQIEIHGGEWINLEEEIGLFQLETTYRRRYLRIDQTKGHMTYGNHQMCLKNIACIIPLRDTSSLPWKLIFQDVSYGQEWCIGFSSEKRFYAWLQHLFILLKERYCSTEFQSIVTLDKSPSALHDITIA